MTAPNLAPAAPQPDDTRAAEERNGQVRWLLPAFQNPQPVPVQTALGGGLAAGHVIGGAVLGGPARRSAPAADAIGPWPATLPEQMRAVADLLATSAQPLELDAIATRFKGRGPLKKSLPRILDTLDALGRARSEGAGWRG
jgi:hypothetical protein